MLAGMWGIKQEEPAAFNAEPAKILINMFEDKFADYSGGGKLGNYDQVR
jgi:hypothetical protein